MGSLKSFLCWACPFGSCYPLQVLARASLRAFPSYHSRQDQQYPSPIVDPWVAIFSAERLCLASSYQQASKQAYFIRFNFYEIK
ncbi:MAG: hypothetical protein RIQ62_237 [Bacteroidota bacterium]